MLGLTEVFHKNKNAWLDNKIKYIVNQGGTSCFYPKQKVITSQGIKNISDVNVGDLVLTINLKTNEDEYKKVIDVFCYKNEKETFKVVLKNGHKIISTGDHEFFNESGCFSLKSMLLSLTKGNDNDNMEKNTKFQQIRSINGWNSTLIKLQKLWKNKGFKASNYSRWIFENYVKSRQWKIPFLDDTQVYGDNIFGTMRRNGSKSQGLQQAKQFYRKLRNCNKIRKYFTRLQKQFDCTKKRFFEWYGKINRGECKVHKRCCKKWWKILWKKEACGLFQCFRGSNKGYCDEEKKYLVSRDIEYFCNINQEIVFDLSIEDNHNYYLWVGFKCLVHNSSKTYSILQLLTAIAKKNKFKIDIVGLSTPHLKSGVLNDMKTITPEFGFRFDEFFKESDKILTLDGTLNFLAFDKLGKAHGGRRDILYLNEANHLNYNIAEQLMIRTRKKIFIDYNPTNAFWVHNKIMKDEPEKVCFIKSTYKDNKFLEQSIIDSIESRKGDGTNNFWRVYGLGELGIAEGLIFNNFEQADFDVNSFENYRNGIDWGFSQDPFAFVRSAIVNDCLYICQEVYQRSLLNKDSAPMVKPIVNNELVTCDSAEPKSVADFHQMGINAISARKGAGSVESGIKFLQSFKKIYIHRNCPNLYDEFCNYQWRKDKNGDAMPEPIDTWNHGIDALRYSLERDMPASTARFTDWA